ncbi:MAG TPA: hypothetical protein VGQ26_23420 [Streptosporangiaceae bacterium]|nr:hypothetical protein [Streptosporangiaceae bacterium]
MNAIPARISSTVSIRNVHASTSARPVAVAGRSRASPSTVVCAGSGTVWAGRSVPVS